LAASQERLSSMKLIATEMDTISEKLLSSMYEIEICLRNNYEHKQKTVNSIGMRDSELLEQ
jgi:hypothetical protein